MSAISVHVVSTIGSTTEGNPSLEATDWAIGWGYIPGTLTAEGEEAKALVLLQKPALPGTEVSAEPLGVLYRGELGTRYELLFVTDDHAHSRAADAPGVLGQPAADPWTVALRRLNSHEATSNRLGSQYEAVHLLDEARHAYERSTGSLE